MNLLKFRKFALQSSKVRPDGRCGPNNLLEDGRPAECDPTASAPRQGPCCSPSGFCGPTPAHCNRPGSVDYRQAAAGDTGHCDAATESCSRQPTFAEAMNRVHAECRWREASSGSEDELGDLFDRMDPE